jgi:ferredoxin-type protein NapG
MQSQAKDHESRVTRRRLLEILSSAASVTAISGWLVRGRRAVLARAAVWRDAVIRPPAAQPEALFLSRCIGCGQCGDVCPNGCIRFDRAANGRGMPYLRVREKACILCMRCTRVCPTGALTAVPSDDGDDIQAHVKMGRAVVDQNICNSYNGYACGACVQACPFKGQALKALTWERPVVDPDYCVGCGLCEKACIVYPQAIRVTPQSVLS